MTDQLPDNNKHIPRHIAIIMDGNGRWARSQNLPRLAGHRAGTENLRRVIRACVDFGIQYLTVYAFSTENWGRPEEEVQGLMQIMESVIVTELDELHREGVKLVHLGRLEELNPELQVKIKHALEITHNNHRLVLCLAWNYGGKDEIVNAVRRIVKEGIPAEQITEDTITERLYSTGIPDPDLVIRTAGEMRLSNFLIWQASYAELYVTQVYWPDFDKEELRKALDAYAARDRRYGRLPGGDEGSKTSHA
ncbi:MAG: polyprenyl diphosphate synthase [Anaerolineaceae bacterium]|jgi:undecaprenyl diphosphate synthase